MTPDRTRAERALAYLVSQIRQDWDEPGILAMLRKVSHKPLPDVAAAAIHCAHHRRDQHKPAVIALDGEHWSALSRMAGKPDTDPLPPYLSREKCPSHGQHQPCLACQREAAGPPATTEAIRAIREAARSEGSHP